MSLHKAIIFDKDGTLIDFDATWGPATVALFESLTDDPDQRAELARLSQLDVAAQRLLPGSAVIGDDVDTLVELWSPALPQLDASSLRRSVVERYGPLSLAALQALPTTETALRALSAIAPLAVATNDNTDTARAHMAQLGWTGYFKRIMGYDAGFGAKPGPGMLRAFAEALGIEPGALIMVGDSPHDLDAARACGALAVGVTTGKATRAELAPLADRVIDDLIELREML